MPNGITFDGLHSYDDFGLWLSERPDLGVPVAKTNIVEIPGADGVLDLTEANAGEVKFNNRTLTFTFAAMVNVVAQEEFKATIRNALHGKKIKQIVLDEDQNWYYTGRASVNFTNIMPWKLKCVVTVDAAPYAMKNEITEVSLDPADYTVESQTMTLAENSDAGSTYSRSLFQLGTMQFPDGIPTAFGLSGVRVVFGTRGVGSNTIVIYDADGNTCTVQISESDFTTGYKDISLSTITSAGVDLTKVYMVTVYGVKDCQLVAVSTVAHIVLNNARKTVAAEFDLTAGIHAPAQFSVDVMMNGVVHNIPASAIQPLNANQIYLQSGRNDVYVAPDANIASFVVRYQEGKL